jgi:hypothetical protein
MGIDHDTSLLQYKIQRYIQVSYHSMSLADVSIRVVPVQSQLAQPVRLVPIRDCVCFLLEHNPVVVVQTRLAYVSPWSITTLLSDHMHDTGVSKNNRITLSKSRTEDIREPETR